MGEASSVLLGGLELQQDDDDGGRSRAGDRGWHQDLWSGCWDVVPFLFPFMDRPLPVSPPTVEDDAVKNSVCGALVLGQMIGLTPQESATGCY